jgi:hypothetical protein
MSWGQVYFHAIKSDKFKELSGHCQLGSIKHSVRLSYLADWVRVRKKVDPLIMCLDNVRCQGSEEIFSEKDHQGNTLLHLAMQGRVPDEGACVIC